MSFFDMSALADCALVPGNVRVPLIYSMWTFSNDPTFMQLDDSIYWAEARTLATAGGTNGIVGLNIEPTVVSPSTWRRATNTLDVLNPVLPHTNADVILTQQIIGFRLGTVSNNCVTSGAKIAIYDVLQVKSFDLVLNQHATWLAETQKICGFDGGALAELIRRTGGYILYEYYIPNTWNLDTAPGIANLITVMNRIGDAYDGLGLNHMPLIYPFTIGGAAKDPVLMTAMQPVFNAMRERYGDNIATWASDHVGDPTNYAVTPAPWKAMLAAGYGGSSSAASAAGSPSFSSATSPTFCHPLFL